MKEDGKKTDGWLLAGFVLCGVIFIVTASVLFVYYFRGRQAEKETQKVRDQYVAIVGDNRPSAGKSAPKEDPAAASAQAFSAMKQLNDDYICWLRVPDTRIDNPVVQRDNEYYLNHTFTGERSSRGTIFLDESCSGGSTCCILHGHHMKDGTMFGDLSGFKKEDFRRTHREFTVDWGYGEVTYHIFAVMDVDLTQDGFFDYMEQAKSSDRAAYLDRLLQNSFWHEEMDGAAQDAQLMLLSTCDYGTEDQRLVVCGYRCDD